MKMVNSKVQLHASATDPVTKTHTTDHLIWLDMEMSGLNPDHDRILELAAVVTDAQLNTLAESPVLVVHQTATVLDGMGSWCQKIHGNSGLTAKVLASTLTEPMAESLMLDFLKSWSAPGQSPLCGNSICQDRRFMARYMPSLEAFFHYRNLDVSVFKELARRWKPQVYAGFKKESRHEALADVYESITELKYYRQHFILP